ncbi:GDSL-type esterase/lipase family protein [Enterobacter roggenkampii]|uniref:tail fiber/spike domain-containing protein n=1 Tax=Enterobacter roggenkampii TaxID=1812935 RepID=UPI0005EF414D|nr:GDSL-type esterase/lipase family protein [Enterobacter roggenkampii]KJP77491.1 hypothetical protein SR65_20905 [Enterobacter roggenkampii]
MATQPTNLPVPSESPRDLKFNAGKIDEFVTSMGWTYTDRFGVQHYTIEGMRWLAQQAIAAFGYITLDSFEDGNTLTLPNQVLRLEATGEYYRWDGPLPKDVPENSTPETSGGIGAGKWLSVGDASLRYELSQISGATKIGSKDTNGEESTVQAELDARESASYRDRCITKLAAVDYLVRSKGTFKVLFQGDSLTAGFDIKTTDTVPPENGDYARHATTTYPERLSAFLLEQSGSTATPVIRAISGYTAKQAYEKSDWQSNPSCDLALIMYGVNDASTDNQANHDEYIDYMERHIKRFINWGMGVVVIAPAVGSYGQVSQAAQRYARQIKNLATIYGCAYFDGTEVHNNKEFSSVVSDGIHFNSQGYAILGEAIAAMMMAGGLLPSYKPISSEFTMWPGMGSDHIGYYNPRGTINLARNSGAYTLQKITGEFLDSAPAIALFSFYLDAEAAELDIVGSWQSTSGFQVAIHPNTLSQAGPNVPYYFPEGRSSNNAEQLNATKYASSISNVNTASGAPKHVGVLSGRGWKTISFYTPLDGGGVGSVFLMQLTVRPIPRYLASRRSSASVRRGITEMAAYSYPYRDFKPTGGDIPTALTLNSLVLPLPFDLYGVAYNPADQYFDCGFAKLYISGNHQGGGPVYYEAVIYRGAGGNNFTVSEIKKIGTLGAVTATCGTKARKVTVARGTVGNDMPLEDIIEVGDDSSFVAGATPNEFGLFMKVSVDWTGITTPAGWYTVYLQSFARGMGGASSIMGIG